MPTTFAYLFAPHLLHRLVRHAAAALIAANTPMLQEVLAPLLLQPLVQVILGLRGIQQRLATVTRGTAARWIQRFQ